MGRHLCKTTVPLNELSPPPLPSSGPIHPRDRWMALDILRAFALFGVFMVNMNEFRGPHFLRELAEIKLWGGTWNIDIATYAFINLLLTGKCIAIFTIAFGYGFQCLLDSVRSRGMSPIRFGLRRLGFLGLLGLLHLSLVWFGDILFFYAGCGLFILAFQKSRGWHKLFFASASLILTCLLLFLFWLASYAIVETDHSVQEFKDLMLRALQVYASGSWTEIFTMRFIEIVWGWVLLIVWAPTAVALMLFGAWAAQTQWLERVGRRSRFKFCFYLGMILGIPMNLVSTLFYLGILETSASRDLVWIYSTLFGSIIMALGYIGGFLWILDRPLTGNWARYLASAGRMSLTHYLSQSLLATFIFYSYGLGYYGEIGAWNGTLLALIIFTCQVLLGYLWLQHYRYGPIEWLWRRVSYQHSLCSSSTLGTKHQ